MRPLHITSLLALAATHAAACCGVGGPGRQIVFGDQTNIVVWNSFTHTEHFIRNARFRSDAPDFGFIAPSPTKPDLSEASSEAFKTLAALQPPDRTMSLDGFAASASKSEPPMVHVVQEADVAGYHATTLLANDSRALASWMKQNGYQTTPGIEAWTKPYIAKGWYLTAFKVQNGGGGASTGTVRMSFKTDRPFNPYFVPSDNIKPGQQGTLRVYFVSTENCAATIGDSTPWKDATWQAQVPEETAKTLATQLKLQWHDMPENAQVAVYEDTQFPREASDDIYFTPRPSLLLPVSAGALVVLAGATFLLTRRRKA